MRSVDKYTTEFYQLLVLNEIQETQDQLVSRYRGGLRMQILDMINLFDPVTEFQAVKTGQVVPAKIPRIDQVLVLVAVRCLGSETQQILLKLLGQPRADFGVSDVEKWGIDCPSVQGQQKRTKEGDWLRNNIFRSTCTILGKLEIKESETVYVLVGKETTADLESLWKMVNTRLDFSSAYYPQTEVVNRALEDLLRCWVGDNVRSWDLKLSQAEFSHNYAVNKSSGFSPFQVVYSIIPRSPIDLIPLPSKTRVHGKAEDFVHSLQEVHKQVFAVGEYHKLAARKIGPLEILEKINLNAYRLKLPTHIRTHDVFNIKHLIPFRGDSSNDEAVGNSRSNFSNLGRMMQQQ
ncbi:hypothetical protein JRO89_XS02G0221600 [Xanthoceras sorbifolium]|uniref:Tf2-1-like SH3-like domain-containing protein n=1 Tax=Xanthoceras sorbifolium TaxID=99658 RepID=A0ABQ8IGP9_9ROSI|nr:hypothetical protein JRO89_XS02G0221600 [Xanthoceras sorbifolium]